MPVTPNSLQIWRVKMIAYCNDPFQKYGHLKFGCHLGLDPPFPDVEPFNLVTKNPTPEPNPKRIWPRVADIWPYEIFQNCCWPPSWVWSNWKQHRSICTTLPWNQTWSEVDQPSQSYGHLKFSNSVRLVAVRTLVTNNNTSYSDVTYSSFDTVGMQGTRSKNYYKNCKLQLHSNVATSGQQLTRSSHRFSLVIIAKQQITALWKSMV